MVRFDGFVLQEWFVTNKKASMKLKKQPRETVHQAKQHVMDHHHHHHHPHYQMQHHLTLRRTPVERPGGPVWLADDEQAPIEMEDADKMAEGNRREHEERRKDGSQQCRRPGPVHRCNPRCSDGMEFHAQASKRQKLV